MRMSRGTSGTGGQTISETGDQSAQQKEPDLEGQMSNGFSYPWNLDVPHTCTDAMKSGRGHSKQGQYTIS